MTEPVEEHASHLSDLEALRVAKFASEMGEYLHLPRYRFSIMVDPCEEGALASIHTVTDRHIAQIYLSSEWMERSESERLNTIIHEVCHLLHRDVDDIVNRFEMYMHNYEYNPLRDQYRREIELMVDYLAMFLQDFTKVEEAWEKALEDAEAELNSKAE